MKQAKTFLIFLLFFTITFTNCTSNEIANSGDVNQDKIYQSYLATFKEGMENAEIKGTFRFGGSNGTTLVLSSPSNFKFDNELTKVDSSWGGGAYYQSQIPANRWLRTHELTFTTTDNKIYTNTFTNDSFTIKNLPVSISKKDSLVIAFINPTLQPNDYIEINSQNSDSSFHYTTSTVNGNTSTVIISVKDIARQKSNKVEFEAILNKQINLANATSEGGRINIRYALKNAIVKLIEVKD